jgi:non-specific serine/threonine protein kinase/serine/threonine-protein kinase
MEGRAMTVPMDDTRPAPGTGLNQVPLTRADGVQAGGSIELLVGQRLGPFELRRLLGTGGMGQVFLADQLQPVQRQVALKFMQHRLANEQSAVRFEIERQALARMSHPAIAQVFEAGTTADGFPYLAMEYIPGEPISDYCRRQRLNLDQRLELFIRVALGVQHAHHKNILHLDLKPANLLVTEVDGVAQPKIIDFGLAVSSLRIPGQRSGWALAGTPGYMSPEQAGVGNDDGELDARSDVYALGVVLYQLLADATPFVPGQFSGSKSEELRQAFDSYAPLPPSERLTLLDEPRRARRLRGDLDAIVAKAMCRPRALRYESVTDLIDDLRRFRERRPIGARALTRRHRVGLYLARNRLQIGIAAALTLTLLAGLAAATWGLIQARHERDIAAMRQRELERVTEFQQSMLSGLDPAILGQNLKATLAAQFAAALKGQADVAERASTFEQELTLANPTEAARQLLDVDLLDRALTTIERELADQPLVAAELRLSISQAYRAIGRFDAALRSGAAAADGFERTLGPLHLKSLQARAERSQTMRALGRGREDLPALQQLIAEADTVGGAAIDVSLQAQLLQAEILGLEGGRLGESVATARNLLQAHQARFGNTAAPTLAALQVLAALAGRNGDLAGVAPLLQQVYDAQRAQWGDEDARTLAALEALGANLGQRGEYAQALPLLEQALALRRKVQGSQHPSTLTTMNSVSITLSRLGRQSEAIVMAEDALELRTRALGRDHPATLRSLLNLGAFHAVADDIPRAALLTRECYERRLRALGPDNPDVYTAAQNLADFEIALGRPAEALRLAEQTHAQRLRLLGADHIEVYRAEEVLARALVAAGEFARALPLLESQLQPADGDDAPSPRARSMAAWYLAVALRGLGRDAQARQLMDTEMDGLLDATHQELNPPERLALQQLKAYRAGEP